MEVINIPRVGSSSLLQVPDSVHNNLSPHTLAMSPQSKSKGGRKPYSINFPPPEYLSSAANKYRKYGQCYDYDSHKAIRPKKYRFFRKLPSAQGQRTTSRVPCPAEEKKKTNCGHFVTRVVWFCFSARKFLLKLILICCL